VYTIDSTPANKNTNHPERYLPRTAEAFRYWFLHLVQSGTFGIHVVDFAKA
jgi:hypothetical protein